MKYFCLPADFQHKTVDAYAELNEKAGDSKIIETYGQMAPDSLFGSCRISRSLPKVDQDKLSGYIKHSAEKGIEFNYVVNATCMENDELTREGFKKLKEFFRVLEGIGVTSVTLALPSLMEIARYAAPGLEIKASTVCQINSPLKAGFYEELGIKRIVLDEDIYRRFDILKNIRKVYSGELEIIVNSFCCMDCPYKMYDYNNFSHSHIQKDIYPYYGSRCKYRHIGEESFMKLNWIRPEDLHFYYETGIRCFKLQGRTNVSTGDPVKAVTAYMDERYDGDLVRLLELFSPKRPLAIVESAVDNRKLDGFFEKFFHTPDFCTKLCEECGYCKSFGEASISKVDRVLMDIMKSIHKSNLDEFPRALEQ